jgi:hypothetical protein
MSDRIMGTVAFVVLCFVGVMEVLSHRLDRVAARPAKIAPCHGFVWFRMFRGNTWHHWHKTYEDIEYMSDCVLEPMQTTTLIRQTCCRCHATYTEGF